MKRITYFIIITFLLSLILTFPAIAEDTTDKRIKVVADLGFITGDEADNLNLDKYITRAETANIIYKLKIGDTESEIRASRQIFNDVDVNHWAAGFVEYLYDANIVAGDQNGNFRPNDSISASELYKMLLYVAGYGDYIQSIGSFPVNVMQVAVSTKLNKDIRLDSAAPLTRKEAFIIIYNFLQINTLTCVSLDQGNPIYEKGAVFLNDPLNIYLDKGIVTGADNVASDGKKISDGMVEIDGKLYKNEAGLTIDHIGMNGEYYYTDDESGIRILLSFIPIKNSIIEISSQDIISFSQNTYTYSASNGNIKKIELNPGKDIYYNGHTVLSEFYTIEIPRVDADGNPVIDSKTGTQIIDKIEKNYMKPEYGKIKLIDNDDDKKYDIVIVDEYQNVLCDFVSENSMTIHGKTNGENVSIELSKLKDYTIRNINGETVPIRNITKDTLVMLQYYDNNTGLTVTVCDSVVEGRITNTDNDEENLILTIDGVNYTVAKSNANGEEEIKFKSNAVLHLDIYGNVGGITYSKSNSQSEWKYGFILRITRDIEDETIPVKITLVDTSGEIKDYLCAEKLKVDGVKAELSIFNSIVTCGQVIRFYINSKNEISFIDTANAKSITDWEGTVSENDALLERITKRYVMCKTTNKAFYNNSTAIFYDSDTVFLRVPDIRGATTYDRNGNYARLTDANLVHKGLYTISAYNTDPDRITADYIVIYDDEQKIAEGSHVLLVDNVSKILDDDEITYQIKGLYDGQWVSYTLKDASLINIGTHKIQKGDVIKIRLISKKITNVQLIYSIENANCSESLLGPLKNTTTSTDYNAAAKFEFGWIERVQSPNIVFKRNINNSSENPYSFYKAVDTFSIYIYDKANGKDSISIGTINDIKSKETYSSKCDTVIAGVESTNGQTLILIRNDGQ